MRVKFNHIRGARVLVPKELDGSFAGIDRVLPDLERLTTAFGGVTMRASRLYALHVYRCSEFLFNDSLHKIPALFSRTEGIPWMMRRIWCKADYVFYVLVLFAEGCYNVGVLQKWATVAA